MLKTQGVAAVERALAILDAFIGTGPLGLAELAKVTSLAKPTVLRALVSLDQAGYIVRLEDGRYALGAKTAQLGASYRAGFNLDRHIMPVLRRLSQETQESCAFHIREKNSRLCLLRVESPQLVRDMPQPTQLAPLDMTSTGCVLTRSAWPAWRAGDVTVYASAGIFDAQTASLSTAVFGLEGTLAGALTISGPIERLAKADLPALARILSREAHGLSRILGAALPAESPEPLLTQLSLPNAGSDVAASGYEAATDRE
ncbi:IclR family transcriptional regulator [Methylobacterium phyllosphaerae]